MNPLHKNNDDYFPMNVACPLEKNRLKPCRRRSASLPLHLQPCRTDDHDGCPIYLGYLLRHTKSFRSDNDWLDAGGPNRLIILKSALNSATDV